jgi:hypothetical protein
MVLRDLFVVYLALLLVGLTDVEKQEKILQMTEELCGELPPELVIAVIRQEDGAGAFYCDGWRHNSFYSRDGGPWAQPSNGDGIMQVTAARGWHEVSGAYEGSESGYRNAISDGCGYLKELYRVYDSEILAAMHYNSGPNTLYIYLNGMGDIRYLSKLAGHLVQFVPEIYGMENDAMAERLYEAQEILDSYLDSLPAGMTKTYYVEYQEALDEELGRI